MQTKPEPRSRTFVSFSGMDGAGKSTQIQNLRDRLASAGLKVSVITFWDDVAQLASLRAGSSHALFKGDKGIGSPEAPIVRRDKNVRSWPMTAVRYFIYFADALSLRRVVKRALRSDADFIIFDRYAYDEMSNLTLTNPITRAYVRLLMLLVPRPHISYLLDADPEQAFRRKPEYPLEYLYLCRASYHRLNQLIGGMTVIPPLPIEQATAEVLGPVLERLTLPGTLPAMAAHAGNPGSN
jgi:thymidylate kinase